MTSCVIARIGETAPGLLAIADIIADHRPATTDVIAARASRTFASLPGCEVLLASDDHGGYLAVTRAGKRFSIRHAHDGRNVSPAMAETCAAALYAWSCSDSHPASRARTSSA